MNMVAFVYFVYLFCLSKFQTDEITRLNGIYKRLLSNAGVKLFEGEGKVVGPHEVEVTQLDGTKLSYSAKHILIATGSRAQRPGIPGQVDFHVLFMCYWKLMFSGFFVIICVLPIVYYCGLYTLQTKKCSN